MTITTGSDRGKRLIRYKRGCCVDGVDYGPDHKDEPVLVRGATARLHVELGRAEYVSPDEEADGEVGLPFEPQDVNISDLAEVLANIEDASIVEQLMAADERKTAREHYEARLAQFES